MVEPSDKEKFLYYTLGLTPRVEAREWVEHDLGTMGWRWRRAAQIVVGSLLGLALGVRLIGISAPGRIITHPVFIGGVIGALIGALLQATVMADYIRRRNLAYYRKRWQRRLTA